MQALSKAPAMSNVKRYHFVPNVRARQANLTTVVIASAVDLPAVNPYCCGGICPVDSRKWLSFPISNFSRHLLGTDSKLMPR